MLLYHDESKKLKDKEFDNVVFEQIVQEIIERKTTNISTISKDIKLKNMFVKQIVICVKKITSLNERKKQIKIIYVINYFRKFLILIAKTSFNKSLIFNVLFLFSLVETSVVIIVLFLKLISEQQFNRVKHYNCKSDFIYDVNHKSRIDRLRIAIDLYIYNSLFALVAIVRNLTTQVYISSKYNLSFKFTQNVISNIDFRSYLIIVIINEMHFVHN